MDLIKVQVRVVYVFCFVVEMVMWVGEIVGLIDKMVDRDMWVVMLFKIKNGMVCKVLLFIVVFDLLDELFEIDGLLFDLSNQQIDVMFCKVWDKLEIEDLWFYDSCYEVIMWLVKKVDVLSLV